MMANQVPLLSPEEYLELERKADVCHQYTHSEIFATAGSSNNHTTIVLNTALALRPFARGQGCRLYPQDVKVKIEAKSRYYYPDILVTCDPRDREDRYVKRYSKLIVEVLSESTEAFDRGKKFEDYHRSNALEEYILVAQDRIFVDMFRRNDIGRWELEGYGPGDDIEIVSLGDRLAIADLYEDLVITPETPQDTILPKQRFLKISATLLTESKL